MSTSWSRGRGRNGPCLDGGDQPFEAAIREGGLRVEGPRDLVRAFPTWLLLSHFAHVERPARIGSRSQAGTRRRGEADERDGKHA